ncbi:MAG TPA: hypothetical protein VET51_13735 [Burkholderiales bacterium]|nr:hypothetical protein [Burkholderiales bacterium]
MAVTLRRRSPWEAMDLGLSMLQRWARRVYAPHLAVGISLGAIFFAIAWLLDRPWIALVLVWWMKPLYDRVVLYVLSRAVFGEVLGLRAVLGAARQWLGSGLLAALTLGRFDTARSFNLPVRQLEGQTWRKGRERRSVLGRRARGYAVWLTIACVHFELVLYWSLQTLAELFLPAKAAEGRDFWESLFEGRLWTYADVAAYSFAMLMIEPFYVAAGFALYLNRRTILEGWDIEVALRRLAQRHAVTALLLIFVAAFPLATFAQPKNPKAEIAEVLKAPEFPHEVESMQWRSRNPQTETKRADGFDWRAIGYALAKAAEAAFWVIAGAALVYALWWAARMLPRAREPQAEPYRPPPALFGMDLAPHSLPADVAAAAAALAREGRLREALSLLYRGALSELVHRRGVELLASHTEAEVLSLSPQESRNYLKSLVDAWRQCAYANRIPPASEVERLALDYKAVAA